MIREIVRVYLDNWKAISYHLPKFTLWKVRHVAKLTRNYFKYYRNGWTSKP